MRGNRICRTLGLWLAGRRGMSFVILNLLEDQCTCDHNPTRCLQCGYRKRYTAVMSLPSTMLKRMESSQWCVYQPLMKIHLEPFMKKGGGGKRRPVLRVVPMVVANDHPSLLGIWNFLRNILAQSLVIESGLVCYEETSRNLLHLRSLNNDKIIHTGEPSFHTSS